MEHEITGGAILVKDDALLPRELHFESEPCVPGWKVATDLAALALDREIQKTGWTFFCFAGETTTSVFGIDRTKMIRRAIEAILARKPSGRFNSLEILKVKFVKSERFPLVQHLTLSARWRHIQQGIISLSVPNVSNSYMQLCDIRREVALAGSKTLQRLIA
jgi:hypothetical protein